MEIKTMSDKPSLIFSENDVDFVILDKKFEDKLDSKILQIEEFIKQVGIGKEQDEKDELYKNAGILHKEYSTLLKEARYNFNINEKLRLFLSDLVLNKLEYDVNTVFFAIELDGLLRDSTKSEKGYFQFPIGATEITYIYHLISKHKVKGLTEDSFSFVEILLRIGSISKVFDYYDNQGKNLSEDILDWVSCFEEGVTKEDLSERT